jgi:hypothetical protein
VKRGKRKMIKHTKKSWSIVETAKLILAWEKEVPIERICSQLGRTSSQIRAKISNLRNESRSLRAKLESRALNTSSRITAKVVPVIRDDRRPLKVIGGEYGVSGVTIWKIKNRQIWKDA